MSEESRRAVQGILRRSYRQVEITLLKNLRDLTALVDRQPDLVFLSMKFLPAHTHLGLQDPEKIWLADYLEAAGIPITGSSTTAHRLEVSKPAAKQRMIQAGLSTSRFYVARHGHPPQPEDLTLRFPVFIKPANRGGGLGVDQYSLAHSFTAALSKVLSISRTYCSDSLVEEYLPGREYSVAILRHENDDQFDTMPIELIAQPNLEGARILSAAVKSSNSETALPVDDPTQHSRISRFALNVFRALGGRDYGRIDIRLDAQGTPHFLEANLMPSLIRDYGSFPKACVLNQNIDQEAMLLRIVQLGFQRAIQEK